MWETQRVFHISTGTLSVSTAQGRMGSFIIVHPCPRTCVFSYISQSVKHIAIKHILSEGSVKSFYQTILCRLARLDKLPLYVVLLTPAPNKLSNKLWHCPNGSFRVCHATPAVYPAPRLPIAPVGYYTM